MEPKTTTPAPAPTAMDVVAPASPAPVEEALATPPPEQAPEAGSEPTIPAEPLTPALVVQSPAPVSVATVKTPKPPGVGLAITATVIIITVIASLAVVAYIKR